MIYCANAGDCRAILARKETEEVTELSKDHKPQHEIDRITLAGGFVE